MCGKLGVLLIRECVVGVRGMFECVAGVWVAVCVGGRCVRVW